MSHMRSVDGIRFPIEQRLWARSLVSIPDACWPYLGYCGSGGYGWIKMNRKLKPAHRVAWILVNGPVPDDMLVCHRCDNPPCVNPGHLFLGTNNENMADMVGKSRQAHGEGHGRARLSAAQVLSIRARHTDGESLGRLAREFGVAVSTIQAVTSGRRWKHLRPAEATP